jgi:hypothetical protein
VPATKRIKPKSCSQLNVSCLTPGILIVKKNIQIRTVLEVSIVDLYAADAFLVTATPKALKDAILKQIRTLNRIMVPFSPKSLKALFVSSRSP